MLQSSDIRLLRCQIDTILTCLNAEYSLLSVRHGIIGRCGGRAGSGLPDLLSCSAVDQPSDMAHGAIVLQTSSRCSR